MALYENPPPLDIFTQQIGKASPQSLIGFGQTRRTSMSVQRQSSSRMLVTNTRGPLLCERGATFLPVVWQELSNPADFLKQPKVKRDWILIDGRMAPLPPLYNRWILMGLRMVPGTGRY